jgi:Domain of unknown function (DUF4253)
MPTQLSPEERKRQADEARAKAIATFPFERVETGGAEALATWERLNGAGRGFPVVLGSDEHVAGVADDLRSNYPETHPARRSAEEILAAAARLRHPEDLIAKRVLEEARGREYLQQLFANPDTRLPQGIVVDAAGVQRELTPEETRALFLREPQPPPLGEWPAETDYVAGLSVTIEIVSGRTLEKVHVGLIPTGDWTTIPAHLRWGGWNACPHPEYHVAALRAWRDRFGAELVGLSRDRMDVRVARPPQSRAQALDLAREHYVYCSDIVDQGVGTLSALAALLLGNEWWSFWWD